jgi:putative effector of murein hydrolase
MDTSPVAALGFAINSYLILICALGAACGMIVCILLEKLFRTKKAENLRAFMVGVGSAFALLVYQGLDPLPTGIAVALGAACGVFAVALLLKIVHWLSKGKDE